MLTLATNKVILSKPVWLCVCVYGLTGTGRRHRIPWGGVTGSHVFDHMGPGNWTWLLTAEPSLHLVKPFPPLFLNLKFFKIEMEKSKLIWKEIWFGHCASITGCLPYAATYIRRWQYRRFQRHYWQLVGLMIKFYINNLNLLLCFLCCKLLESI